MLGFMPGFPYLGGLDAKLHTPRRSEPRIKINAGSVGIANNQTGLYPMDSPGGWQIIGRTPIKVFDLNRTPMTLYEAGDCSECPLKQQCMNFNSKTNKKIMKNYNWEYFKAQINKKLSEPKTKTIYSQRKIDVEPVFGFMKAILGFTRMSVRGIDKAKRELGFVLMALNIRKVTAQRAENNQKNNKKDNFYIISIEIVFFYLSWDFMSHTL